MVIALVLKQSWPRTSVLKLIKIHIIYFLEFLAVGEFIKLRGFHAGISHMSNA